MQESGRMRNVGERKEAQSRAMDGGKNACAGRQAGARAGGRESGRAGGRESESAMAKARTRTKTRPKAKARARSTNPPTSSSPNLLPHLCRCARLRTVGDEDENDDAGFDKAAGTLAVDDRDDAVNQRRGDQNLRVAEREERGEKRARVRGAKEDGVGRTSAVRLQNDSQNAQKEKKKKKNSTLRTPLPMPPGRSPPRCPFSPPSVRPPLPVRRPPRTPVLPRLRPLRRPRLPGAPHGTFLGRSVHGAAPAPRGPFWRPGSAIGSMRRLP